MDRDLRIVFEIFGRSYVSTDVDQLDKDLVIKCLTNILTQIHNADTSKTSGSEFKHRIRNILKEGRKSIDTIMVAHIRDIQEK